MANEAKRRFQSSDEAIESLKLQRKKFIACQRCHAHKIKCSGERPCVKCRLVGCADECEYPSRDRRVKVNESYLELVLAENRYLKEQHGSLVGTGSHAEAGPDLLWPTGVPDEGNASVRNPLIGDRAWFHQYDPSAPPIFIGDAACTAFATRFRQFLTGSTATAHIPRMQYVPEQSIAAASRSSIQWPSLQQARLLVKIALHQVGRIYHLVLGKSTLEKLEEIYHTGEFGNITNQCKFFALFAFGEAYSLRPKPESGPRVPGTAYFARAMTLVQILPERPSITHLEALLLLSLFSYYLNRRHTAYVLIGSAMRLGLTVGLNHNIPESQLIDPVERQHRIRIFWTIYICDRIWGSKMGLPSQISDEDIHLDMPSSISPPELCRDQFSDTEYLKANINLARIVGETITKLYSRRKYSETFLQRVQKLLKALKSWVETLPEHLRLNQSDPEANKKHIVSLHLTFNQCVILATRPTLLHFLIKHSGTGLAAKDPGLDVVSQPLITLAEACIHAARHSHSLILKKWVNGSMPVFGYFHAHYLFSSAVILAMSSLVSIGSPSDLNAFEASFEMLSSMSENGNLAASDFFQNLEQVRLCLDSYREQTRKASAPGREVTTAVAVGPGNSCSTPSLIMQGSMIPTMTEDGSLLGAANVSSSLDIHDSTEGFTTAMAFLEPTMQDFLAQSDFDLGGLHSVDTFMNESESLYMCHEQ